MLRGEVLARFYRPGGGGFELLFAWGWRIRPSETLPGGFATGNGQACN